MYADMARHHTPLMRVRWRIVCDYIRTLCVDLCGRNVSQWCAKTVQRTILPLCGAHTSHVPNHLTCGGFTTVNENVGMRFGVHPTLENLSRTWILRWGSCVSFFLVQQILVLNTNHPNTVLRTLSQNIF